MISALVRIVSFAALAYLALPLVVLVGASLTIIPLLQFMANTPSFSFWSLNIGTCARR